MPNAEPLPILNSGRLSTHIILDAAESEARPGKSDTCKRNPRHTRHLESPHHTPSPGTCRPPGNSLYLQHLRATANVMTRDAGRVHDDRDQASEAEMYAALWAAAPFPRLPDDAPHELTKLAIDIDDPKRVYTIYKASRRHHFQLLVDRYILQIRYGCTYKTCSTPTCFSCRKRLAGSAPIRRYNATSARTLAVYLASQDNPEQGLCHHPSVVVSALSEATKSANTHSVPAVDVKHFPQSLDGRRLSASQKIVTNEVSDGSEASNAVGNGIKPRRKTSMDDVLRRKVLQDLTVLEEPSTTDHLSFVQNIFGTTAFKMLEWLAPRNFDILSRSANTASTSQEESHPVSDDVTAGPEPRKATSKEITFQDGSQTNSTFEKRRESLDQKTGFAKSTADVPLTIPPSTKVPPEVRQPATESRSGSNSLRRRTSDVRRRAEPLDSPPKGILNKSTKTSDTGNDISPLSSLSIGPLPKRKVSRQTLITSPKMQMTEMNPFHDLSPVPAKTLIESVEYAKIKQDEVKAEPCLKEVQEEVAITPKRAQPPKSRPTKPVPLPQSLGLLSIETIDFFCDIIQSDGTGEKHFLQPQTITPSLKRRRDNPSRLYRRNLPSNVDSLSRHSTRHQWQCFVQQSFFDVLGRPESLLRSFSDENNKLFDTQTIWYLMLRLTRVAPSLVFDSLWKVAGTLFRPPEKLEETYEWAKEFQSHRSFTDKPISNNDAAQAINICLHALVAAAPLVFDARQLANMSRVRSYGLAMLGRESSSLEPAALCLQYEDAFTNELALRLARRVFAAIPTRRRFIELLELQRDIRNDDKREPDVLETVLSTLKFLDLGTPPVLNFPDDERDLHEKRVPTLILDWARTVMLQDWQGAAEVPIDGPFGGALATMAAIYKNRKSLLLGDIHFRTEYFAERLDPAEMPLEWLSFQPNKKTVHLLDYPYLFNPSTIVTYFRAINYSRMNHAYEEAKAACNLVYTVIQENSLMTDKSHREKLSGRLRTAMSRFMVLEIRRNMILTDTFNSIWRREERELMRPLKIRLGEEGGEEGLDSGGVQQEFFRLAIAEALNPEYGTFTIDARTQMTWFQPGSPEPLWKFELIGMIISLAVYNGLTLPVTFPKALYRKLLSEEVTELHHIADGWPDLANGLTQLLEWDEKDGLVEDVFARTYEFSVEQFGQPVSREMGISAQWPQFSELSSSSNPPDAPLVTNENRNNYVSDYIRWLTDVSIRPQYQAFQAGFFACIDRRSISLFDPDTLQSVVEGIQEIDISEMRRATRYIGWDASHRSVRDFWSIVKRYDIAQKRKLLEFVTASDRVPVGGMRNLQFTLQRNGVDDGHLPSSYTCYGILLLPEYSSKDVLREKLGMALENSKGFGFA